MVTEFTAQKMKFSIKDFFSKCDQIWSHLLRKSLVENFICCVLIIYEVISKFFKPIETNTFFGVL